MEQTLYKKRQIGLLKTKSLHERLQGPHLLTQVKNDIKRHNINFHKNFSQSKPRDIPLANGHIPEPPVIILTYVLL